MKFVSSWASRQWEEKPIKLNDLDDLMDMIKETGCPVIVYPPDEEDSLPKLLIYDDSIE